VAFYRAPPWLPDKLPTEVMLWRVVAADPDGNEFAASEWRELNIGG
jgi:hypothetical protein